MRFHVSPKLQRDNQMQSQYYTDITIDGLFKLDESHAEEAGRICGRAYFDNEACVWFFPDPKQREQLLSKTYEFRIRMAMLNGAVFATSEKLEGFGSLIHSNSPPLTPEEQDKCGVSDLLQKMNQDAIHRVLQIGDESTKLEQEIINGSFIHLRAVAVIPELQGKGNLNSLMFPILHYLDQEQLRCYIEVQGEPNATIYKKYGFQVLKEHCIADGTVQFWPMVRLPQ